jgi:hypothetical protein
MAMNSIETAVLRIIGENIATPDVFENNATDLALIRGSINDAIQEICMVTGSYTKTYFLGLLTNRTFYRLAPQTDYVGYIVECWDDEQKRKLTRTSLALLNRQDPAWLQNTGSQEQYLQIGTNHIGIYRQPSSKGKVLQLKCVCIPKPYIADTDPIKVRDVFQRSATYFAVGEYYASRGDAVRATDYTTKYLELTGLMQLKPQLPERQYQYRGDYGSNRFPGKN